MRRSEELRYKSEKKFPFYGIVGFLTCFSVDYQKPLSEVPTTHLATAFWSWHSWKFSIMKIFVFPNFLEIFFFYSCLGSSDVLSYTKKALFFLKISSFLQYTIFPWPNPFLKYFCNLFFKQHLQKSSTCVCILFICVTSMATKGFFKLGRQLEVACGKVCTVQRLLQ